MSIDDKFDSLYTSDNEYLFDLLFCHQFFLEGYKTGLSNNFKPVLIALYKQFEQFFKSVRYSRMDNFTRAELNAFIYLFRRAQLRIYSAYTQKLIAILQDFVKEDTLVNAKIMQRVLHYDHATANENRLQNQPPHATVNGPATLTNADAMWSAITNAPIPGVGITLLPAINNLFASASKRVEQLITMGWANGDSLQDTMASILGDPQTKTGGFISKLQFQHSSLANTLAQHSSAIVAATVASMYVSSYMWVSILDSHTTLICWNRNGNIYVYNEGPLPPAHWGCRSHTVPILPGGDKFNPPATFYAQLIAMPFELQELIVGTALAKKIQEGNGKLTDFPLPSFILPLTLSQFSDKIDLTLQ